VPYRIELFKDAQVFETDIWPDLAGAKHKAAYLILVKSATGAAIVDSLSGEIKARYGQTGRLPPADNVFKIDIPVA
jgi:hypothetical protein